MCFLFMYVRVLKDMEKCLISLVSREVLNLTDIRTDPSQKLSSRTINPSENSGGNSPTHSWWEDQVA